MHGEIAPPRPRLFEGATIYGYLLGFCPGGEVGRDGVLPSDQQNLRPYARPVLVGDLRCALPHAPTADVGTSPTPPSERGQAGVAVACPPSCADPGPPRVH